MAVTCGDRHTTYRALCERAHRLADRLVQAGVGPEVRVGVLLERSTDLVVGLLAVLMAGGAYVALDPAYPRERLDFMIEDADVRVLVSDPALAARLSVSHPAVLDVNRGGEPGPRSPASLLGSRAPDGALAYVIYTSGSTGRPKGVGIERRNLATFLAWVETAFSPDEMSRVLASTSVCFDLSVFEIFATLAMGGTVVLVRDALALIEEPSLDVTLLNTVPSAMAEIAAARRIPASARTINLAGEPLRLPLVEQIQAQSRARLLNLYGPSEDTTYSTIAPIPRGQATAPTIGRPVAATRAYALDDHLEPVPDGVIAELHLAGDHLSRGYLGRPALTAERFLPDPCSPSGERMYRTGDRVRLRADGEIELVGRRDHQVKVRGFRIELGEIEARLLETGRCAQAVAVVRDDLPGGPGVVAYVVTSAPAPAADLEAFLRDRLPAHLIPSAFVSMDALPLSPNGKIDRARLPSPGPAAVNARDHVPPSSPSEIQLAATWQGLLGVPAVGRDDSFFDLGGQSLVAVRLASRIRDQHGVDLPLREIFAAPRLADMAARIDAVRRDAGPTRRPALRPRNGARRSDPVLSHAQERMWFVHKLEPGSSAYNVVLGFEIDGPLDVEALTGALDRLVRRHDVLRTRFPEVDGRPRAVIEDEPPALQVIDLGAARAGDREARVQQLRDAATGEPFDLERGPLVRATLVRFRDDRHLLLFGMHHIVSDAWSLGIAAQEIGASYQALAGNREPDLPPLPVQYSDFAAWQRAWLGSAELEAELAYWRSRLAGAPRASILPGDRPAAPAASKAGRSTVALPPAVVAGLDELCRREGATLFMGLLAAFAALLSRWSGQDDLVVGTPVAGREHAEVEGLIGCFINTLALRVELDGDPTFTALVARVARTTLDAYAHRNAPFQAVVAAAGAERGAESSLVQVMFTFQNIPTAKELQLPGLRVVPVDLEGTEARRDLTVRVEERGDELAAVFEYDTARVEERTIAALAERFAAMTAAAAARPALHLSELPWETAAEREQAAAEAERRKRSDHARLKAFVGNRPAATRAAPHRLVEIADGFPSVARPASRGVDLVGWLAAQRALVDDLLLRRGAILWRGFHLADEDAFERLAGALSGASALMHYDEGSTPRSVVHGKVYTSTEYSAAQRIPLHCEMAYSHRWPARLWFWCRRSAIQGGATPIAQSRAVLARLSAPTIERFRARGIMYVRNFAEGLDVPWQRVFRTNSREAVASYCAEAGIQVEWRPGGALRTRHVRPALAIHPRTGEEVWFNQAHLFHTTSLEPDVRLALLESLPFDELPRNACYGDGAPIEDDVIAEIDAAYQAAAVELPWQDGDILLVDNMLVAHGRTPFEGPRRVLVVMAEPLGGTADEPGPRSAQEVEA
ncbi:MAG TPA: amino acid adenylation domain-containing protein [Kofleriaceae bacterium]|nr:amino acid adenylation domain-containing protein [Kofleriaceae bacterium]